MIHDGVSHGNLMFRMSPLRGNSCFARNFCTESLVLHVIRMELPVLQTPAVWSCFCMSLSISSLRLLYLARIRSFRIIPLLQNRLFCTLLCAELFLPHAPSVQNRSFRIAFLRKLLSTRIQVHALPSIRLGVTLARHLRFALALNPASACFAGSSHVAPSLEHKIFQPKGETQCKLK